MADPTVTHESETGNGLSAERLGDSLTEGADWPLVWISLTASLGIYLAAAAALALVIDSDTAALCSAAAASLGVLPHLPEFMRPEPLERARYLLGLACIPLLPTAAFVAALRLVPPRLRTWCNRPGPLAARDMILLTLFSVWFCGLGLASRVPNSGLLMLAALPLAGYLLLAGGASARVPRWLAWPAGLSTGGWLKADWPCRLEGTRRWWWEQLQWRSQPTRPSHAIARDACPISTNC